jgi:hypothetical protein
LTSGSLHKYVKASIVTKNVVSPTYHNPLENRVFIPNKVLRRYGIMIAHKKIFIKMINLRTKETIMNRIF